MKIIIAGKRADASSGQRVARLALPVEFVPAKSVQVPIARIGRSIISDPVLSSATASAGRSLVPYHLIHGDPDRTFDFAARKCC